jgi:hypothetical protein
MNVEYNFEFFFIQGPCMNAEALLAAALKSDLARSVTLGFTMVWQIQVIFKPTTAHTNFQIAEISVGLNG